jgi:hypothetical protein
VPSNYNKLDRASSKNLKLGICEVFFEVAENKADRAPNIATVTGSKN